MHSDFDLTEIVLKHNVPTWSLRDHVRTSSSRFSYEIHTAFIYTKDDNHGAASISTAADHRAEAVHAALQSEIVKLKDLGKTLVKWGARTCLRMSSTRMSKLRNPEESKELTTMFNTLFLMITELYCGAIINKFHSHSRDQSIWPISCWDVAKYQIFGEQNCG